MIRQLGLGCLLAALWAVVCAPQAGRAVVVIDIDGVVHPVTVEIVGDAIAQAEASGACCLLIRINTPGGFMEATRQVVEKMVASKVPIITYVHPAGGRAASAGFFILEAGDVAAMTPGTSTGAAHPVMLGGQADPVMMKKVENDAAASLRSQVSHRGRDVKLAEAAVLQSRSFTDKEALEGHLIEVIAADVPELIAALNGREVTRFDGRKQRLDLAGAHVVEYQKTLRQRIYSALADPNLAFALLILGALGIYVEFSSPGLIVPGVAGAIAALLGLSGLAILPINWGGAALIVLALALFALEAKFVSHGILGVGGAVAMVLGAVMLVDSPIPEMRIRLSTAFSLALPFAAITMFLLSLIMRSRKSRVLTGDAGMVGETGVAITDLAPSGRVMVHGEYWNAVSSAPVKADQPIRVTALEGLKLVVEPATSQSGG
jgi:membrane-bound serine protease (ClpP class)